ncbi:CsbD family protein [Kineococcus sp. NBC_00420]|uniref:CsbD family protein n=1 Tax=Kineococcus sp. NBC_00420 TaxID=2903564 RepID=UPI002E1ED7AF
MGIVDKAKNAAEKATGQAKEKLGDAQGDEQLKAEGQSEKVTGSAKQAGENVKDAFK